MQNVLVKVGLFLKMGALTNQQRILFTLKGWLYYETREVPGVLKL